MDTCYSVYLDDIRSPHYITESKRYNLVVCRSYSEFKSTVEAVGELPYFISFDHDLGEGAETGYDVARWVVEQVLNGTYKLPGGFSYSVHSANPPGADNIQGLLDSFVKFYREIKK